MFANGADAKEFITNFEDYKYQFNLMAIAARISGATVVAFNIEETHPHTLLYGTPERCRRFMDVYDDRTRKHIAYTRKSLGAVNLNFTIYKIDSEEYLRSTGCYVITQATKDGKAVMPYDYFWGTGSMYFRDTHHIPIWHIDNDGNILTPSRFGSYNYRQKKQIFRDVSLIPDEWMICQGLILPSNYVDVERFEKIYRTHNCFRVFSSGSRKEMEKVSEMMSYARGVVLDDLEASSICKELCLGLFGVKTARHLSVPKRVALARELQGRYRMSLRQIATLSRLPAAELEKYL